VTGLEYDPNPDNNQATFILNIPYVDPENQIPEVPSNLPDNGMATVPPIPNIEDLMDLDIYQPGPNPIPPNNPPNPPGPDTPGPNPPTPPDEPGPNPPGPDIPDPNPPTSPAPNPPTEPQNPSTQLGRDIAGVRQAVASGNMEGAIPDWNLEIEEPISDEEEIKEWTSFLIKLSIELMAFAAVSAVSEYIQGIISAITNYFKVLNIVTKYFGINKYLKPVLDYLERATRLFENPTVKSIVDMWSKFLDVVSPNVGMKLLERTLIKLFPSQTAEINYLMTIISTKEFLEDPLGAINAIYDILLGIFTSEPLEPADLEKLTIIEPMQSSG